MFELKVMKQTMLLPILWVAANSFGAPSADKLKSLSPDSPERQRLAAEQVLLDRAGFRPGKIDGLPGEFTDMAAARYRQAHGLEKDAPLEGDQTKSPYVWYQISETDFQHIGEMAPTPEEQSRLQRLPYTTIWEVVAEMFHCDEDFIRELNRGVKDPRAGTNLRVPDVEPFRLADVEALKKGGKKEKSAAEQIQMVLLRKERLLELYQGDKLVGSFPCTPGSDQMPVPEGVWKVTGIAYMPDFRWDKSLLDHGVRGEEAYILPPGPNNPVGVVWISIDRPSVGMHGTLDPDRIGRNESHGCIRLSNWDAFEVSKRIRQGTQLQVY